MKGWKEQFLKSLGKDGPADFSEAMEDVPLYAESLGAVEVATVGIEVLAKEVVRSVSLTMAMALDSCQSPIEVAMFFALTSQAVGFGPHMPTVVVWDGHPSQIVDRIGWGTVEIRPQAQIGEHRVDFLVTFSHDPIGDDGKRTRIERKLIVECDGHDFHDRTKGQASRDRERDRALQAAGYQVFRYTGADLWADVFKCSHEVLRHLMPLSEEA